MKRFLFRLLRRLRRALMDENIPVKIGDRWRCLLADRPRVFIVKRAASPTAWLMREEDGAARVYMTRMNIQLGYWEKV